MKMVSPICLFVLSLALFSMGGLHAQIKEKEKEKEPEREKQDQDPVVLEEVVVTATRSRKDSFEIPYLVTVLDEKDMTERSLFRTTPESLRDIPGVMLQKTGHGQGSPFIRGFTGFRTLFLIDGIRLNNSVFRDGPNQYWNTVDPLSIHRLELVKGPSSVLYGSDAIGGTANALTRGSREYDHRHEGFHLNGQVSYRYASAEASHTARGEVDGNLGRELGFHLGLSGKDFGTLEGGRDVGRQPRTGYREWDIDVKFDAYLNADEKFVFAFQKVDQDDAWRTHKTVHGISWEGTTRGNELKRILDQDRYLGYVQYHADRIGGFIDTVRISLSYHEQSEERYRVRNDGRRDRQGVSVGTVGGWVQLETPSDIGRWTYGADYYYDNVNSCIRKYDASGVFTGASIQGPVADDAGYHLAGIFIQNEIPVTDDLELILGGRYTYARAVAHEVEDPQSGAEISLTERYDDVVGSLRGMYTLDRKERWQLFAGVSQGFRAPNLSDLTRLDSARSNEIETPSPGLDPEKFLAFEVGLKSRVGGLSGEIGYYYTLIDDMIVRTPTGRVIGGENEVTKQNVGDGFVHGVEVSLRYRICPGFTAFGSFAWMDGQVHTFPTSAPVEVREPIDRLMPPMGHAGIRWDHPDQKVWVEGVLSFAARQSDLSTRDKNDTQRIPPHGTPGYAVVSLHGGVEVNENLTLTAALENLTNEDYRIHGSGVNEPGTNVVLGMNVRF